MMAPFDTPDRPRAAEDDYFRRQDEELLESARESQRVSRERQALAEALGSTDDESVGRLYANGLRASTAVAVEWLPAVEVAWLDGADETERDQLRRRCAVDAHEEALAQLNAWLVRPPPEHVILAGRRVLYDRLQPLDADARRTALERILGLCEVAGRAAGGVLGFGTLSSDERRHIESVRYDLDQRP
jgi:hypothetical protein